jgi:hypothetical protein
MAEEQKKLEKISDDVSARAVPTKKMRITISPRLKRPISSI